MASDPPSDALVHALAAYKLDLLTAYLEKLEARIAALESAEP
jgi:hypothetical protein